jgi:hypothetical protein
MHRYGILIVGALLAVASVLLTGCSGDCAWNADFRAWIDENQNGVWDANEPPLPGVKILLESSVLHVPELTTDEKGEVQVHEALSGCPKEAAVFVYVLPPLGYRVSIRTLYPAQEQTERRFEFGFVAE